MVPFSMCQRRTDCQSAHLTPPAETAAAGRRPASETEGAEGAAPTAAAGVVAAAAEDAELAQGMAQATLGIIVIAKISKYQ